MSLGGGIGIHEALKTLCQKWIKSSTLFSGTGNEVMSKIIGQDARNYMAVSNPSNSLVTQVDVHMAPFGEQTRVSAEFLCNVEDLPYLVPGGSMDGMFTSKPIIHCQYCGQWAARKTACKYCGGAVE